MANKQTRLIAYLTDNKDLILLPTNEYKMNIEPKSHGLRKASQTKKTISFLSNYPSLTSIHLNQAHDWNFSSCFQHGWCPTYF